MLALPVRAFLDHSFRLLVRLVLGVFYRRVEVTGRHHLPASPPRLYVGNHGNSLIDPAIALGWLPFGIRFLAKSTLWSHPAVGLFVRLVGAIPVYRHHDPGVDTSRNQQMFERCHELLASGADIALFPEGISHGEPHLMPLKTGAARIALGALAAAPDSGLRIVPFGLVFEDRGAFRSRVLLEIGEPIDPSALSATGVLDRQVVQELTHRIEEGLGRVTVNYSSWEEAHLVGRAVSLYRWQEAEGDSRLAAGASFQRAFAQAYGDLKTAYPEKTANLQRSLRDYDRLLHLAGLSDRQVAGRYPVSAAARFALGALADLLILLPAGLIGTLVKWLPYRIPGWTVTMLKPGEDVRATYMVLISLFLFPLYWISLAATAARFWGWPVGAPLLVIAPLSGYVALRMTERLTNLIS